MMFRFSVLFNSIRGELSRADVIGITTPSYSTADLLLFSPQLLTYHNLASCASATIPMVTPALDSQFAF